MRSPSMNPRADRELEPAVPSSTAPSETFGGSRTATVAGGGIVRAADRIIEKAKALAAHQFEANIADVENWPKHK